MRPEGDRALLSALCCAPGLIEAVVAGEKSLLCPRGSIRLGLGERAYGGGDGSTA